jgi:hypothetical protein
LSNELLIAVISAGSALIGSISGAVVSYFTTSRLNTQKWRQDRTDVEIARREQLYSDFMAEASGLLMKSAEKGQVQAANFNRLLALQMQIRLFSPDEIVESAKKITHVVIHSFVDKRDESDVPKEKLETFSQLCRRELDSIRHRGI